jgi:hypothetical protein
MLKEDVLLPALAVFFLIGIAVFSSLLHRLSSRHIDLWEKLGKPGILRNNSVAHNMALLRFLLRREFRAAGDPALSCLAVVYLVYAVSYLSFFISIVVLLFPWGKVF